VFVDAYNRFGTAKMKRRGTHKTGEAPFVAVNFI
jgi:hypothetical protein